MSTYNSIAWLPLCAGLSGLGLVLSYLAGRKRGLRSFLRGAAWSLLPIAAYLTGSIEMFWKIGSAIGSFATAFVFSPRVWSGIAVAGLAAVLFIASGGRRRRRARVGRQAKDGVTGTGSAGASGGQPALDAGQGSAATTVAVPATRPGAAQPAGTGSDGKAKRGKGGAAQGDDDMKEIEEILRKHGIN
ncbi:MAG: cellulose synthase [Streptosporangiaceae bacterium]|jgi:hypothetical protein